MKKPYPFHDIESDLHSRAKIEPDLESGMEVTRVAWHDEEDDGVGAVGIVVID